MPVAEPMTGALPRLPFPSEIIATAVWLYFRFQLSFATCRIARERGVIVSHETVRQCAPNSGHLARLRRRRCELATSGIWTRSR